VQYARYTFSNAVTGETTTVVLTPEQEKEESNFVDKESGAKLVRPLTSYPFPGGTPQERTKRTVAERRESTSSPTETARVSLCGSVQAPSEEWRLAPAALSDRVSNAWRG
jgi:hypothetical protein